MSSVLDRLHGLLQQMKLGEIDTLLEAHLERAAQKERSYADFLLDLLEAEALAQRDRLLAGRLRQAKLPFTKTLEQFDFAFQPSIEERQIRELRTLRFVHEAANVLFLGPPGVGKTHLAVGLAVEAVRCGFSTLFVTAHDLVTDLGKSAREGKLERKLRYLVSPKVLVVDEIGYLPLDEVGATLFFQLVSARYERGSLILTSNKSYADWGSVFGGDAVIATAVLDRLLHHSSTVNIRGESYRLRERKKAGLPSGEEEGRAAGSAREPRRRG